MAAGIVTRHSRACRSRTGRRCSCKPTYQAQVWSNRDRARLRKTFPTAAAARAWRQDAQVALREGKLRASSSGTLREAADAFLTGTRSGAVCNRSGDPYKPAAIRAYAAALENRVLPALGDRRLSELRRSDVQAFADRLVGEGLAPSTVQVALMPLRAICRRALVRGELAVNPTTGLELPAVRGRRDRIASPVEAAALIAALPDADRALWATAMYGGLRRGEIVALRWEDVDLAAGVIRVERSWDAVEGPVAPKSAVGRRKVPIPSVLRDHLAERRAMQGGRDGLVFGATGRSPLYVHGVTRRADAAWQAMGLRRITLHECRHTFASLMIAAGVNAKALSTFLGHANIAITLDRYGHLMDGSEAEAAERLGAYLEQSMAAARAADNGNNGNNGVSRSFSVSTPR
jgi:integrase